MTASIVSSRRKRRLRWATSVSQSQTGENCRSNVGRGHRRSFELDLLREGKGRCGPAKQHEHEHRYRSAGQVGRFYAGKRGRTDKSLGLAMRRHVPAARQAMRRPSADARRSLHILAVPCRPREGASCREVDPQGLDPEGPERRPARRGRQLLPPAARRSGACRSATPPSARRCRGRCSTFAPSTSTAVARRLTRSSTSSAPAGISSRRSATTRSASTSQLLVDIRPSVKLELVDDAIARYARLGPSSRPRPDRPLREPGAPDVQQLDSLRSRFGIDYRAPARRRGKPVSQRSPSTSSRARTRSSTFQSRTSARSSPSAGGSSDRTGC